MVIFLVVFVDYLVFIFVVGFGVMLAVVAIGVVIINVQSAP